MKLFNDLHYLPMSCIVLPLCIILPFVSFCPSIILPPPGNRLMIYTIYPCPVSFCPLDSFCPHIILPPIILPPGNLLMYAIFPFLYHYAPYHFAPYHFAPPPLEIVSWFSLFTHVQYRFAPWTHFAPYHFAPPPLKMVKWFTLFSHVLYHLPTALDFVFILIKSPLQQKLTTGAHPVTVAPLVFIMHFTSLIAYLSFKNFLCSNIFV